MTNEMKCPFCGRKKTVEKQDGNIYFCSYCIKLFEAKACQMKDEKVRLGEFLPSDRSRLEVV